jgi:hypothetical protein
MMNFFIPSHFVLGVDHGAMLLGEISPPTDMVFARYNPYPSCVLT